MNPPPGWRLLVHETLPSTSDLAGRLAEAGEPERVAVLARRQSAGRGSHGRAWESPVGNMHVSAILRPGGPLSRAGLWGLLAVVALADAVAPHVPDGRRLGVKWPNDLLLGDAKLAGLLTEAAGGLDGSLRHLVIGAGLNVVSAPDLADRRTACLGAGAPAADALACAWLQALDRWRARVILEGFAPVRAAWLARGPEQGRLLVLRRPRGELAGAFAGLADDGALLLSTGGRVHAFAAGET